MVVLVKKSVAIEKDLNVAMQIHLDINITAIIELVNIIFFVRIYVKGKKL